MECLPEVFLESSRHRRHFLEKIGGKNEQKRNKQRFVNEKMRDAYIIYDLAYAVDELS